MKTIKEKSLLSNPKSSHGKRRDKEVLKKDIAPTPRDKIFISHSHKDDDWLHRVKPFLGLLVLRGKVSTWDDTEIPAGTNWQEAIKAALDSSCASILLVSPHFLTSKFIRKTELRLILAAERLGLQVFPILLRRTGISRSPLRKFQFVPRLPTSLQDLPTVAQEKVLSGLVLVIAQYLPAHERALLENISRAAVPCYVHSAFPSVDYQLSGRSHLLTALHRVWKQRQARVVTIVAPGGLGKTALVNHWLQDLGMGGWDGAERVFIWSFYSQGSDEAKQVSSEPFLVEAFKFFGLGEPGRESPWDKGQMLARKIEERCTLLVLDGLETLQEPVIHGPSAGRLRDEAIRSLLFALASQKSGLAVVTTRLAVVDLECRPSHLCPRIDVKRLDEVAGAELLRRLLAPPDAPDWQQKVVARTPDEELHLATEKFGGHPLALRLLAGYLASTHGGDIRQRKQIGPLLRQDGPAGQSKRMMRQYEDLFEGRLELDLLHMVGLFDRPCPPGAIAALRARNIPDLTQRLRRLSAGTWTDSLAVLRKAGLLTQESDGSLDSHPLVREYFGGRLKEKHPRAWKTAQSALFDYFRSLPKKAIPESKSEREALFQAVACGCQAGRFQAAKKQYEIRVTGWDDHGTPRHLLSLALRRFGASSLYLSALYHFFNTPWTEPSRHLGALDRAFVLHEAGHYLFILGRLRESLTPLRLGMERMVALRHWREASTAARLIREVYLYLGEFEDAQVCSEQGIEFADRSGSRFHRMGLRASQAQVLFYRGKFDVAAKVFAEAESIQKKRRPPCPILVYIWGFWYCELLLDRARRLLESTTERSATSEAGKILQNIQQRATKALAVAEKLEADFKSVFDIAHAHQTLGQMFLLRNRLTRKGDLSQAAEHLDTAVDGLRQTGQQHHLVGGLLARAGLRRTCGDHSGAKQDLDEGKGIADRSEMVIHQIDASLEYAQLHHAQHRLAKARRSLAEARAQIQKSGYHRRDWDVEILRGLL